MKSRVEKWKNLPATKASERPLFQLEWEAEVVEYVNLLWNATRSRSNKSTTVKTIGHDVPLLGPRFVPPTYLHARLRPGPLNVKPEMQYLKPITIVHPLYYPELAVCPQCQSRNEVTWEGWTTTGAREVHGIAHEETALGLQLRCDSCKQRRTSSSESPKSGYSSNGNVAAGGDSESQSSELASRESGTMSKESYCFAVTSHSFWKHWNHWDIPGGSVRYYITVSPSWYLTRALRRDTDLLLAVCANPPVIQLDTGASSVNDVCRIS